ncbi:MAG: hypothetical protein ACI9OE_001300, partial [Mariniflexile sp.]
QLMMLSLRHGEARSHLTTLSLRHGEARSHLIN